MTAHNNGTPKGADAATRQTVPASTDTAKELRPETDPGAFPRAIIVEVYFDEGNRLVRARCPYCNELHTHGWPLSSDTPGHRVAHCHAQRLPRRDHCARPEGSEAGYVIAMPEAGEA